MDRIWTAIAAGVLMTFSINVSAQAIEKKSQVNMICLDLGGIIYKDQIRLDFSHKITDKWSATASTAISINMGNNKKNIEEEQHKNEFSEREQRRYEETDSWLYVQYWTGRTFKGGFIHIGCRCIQEMDADILIGGGYQMEIGRGLSVAVSIETDVIARFSEKTERTYNNERIRINLCYAF